MSDLNNLRDRENNNAQNKGNGNRNKFPKHLIFLGILGALTLIAGIVLLVMALTMDIPDMKNDDWFESTQKQGYLGAGAGILLVLGIALIFTALTPVFARWRIKTTRYVAKDNKGELKEIVNTAGDIVGDTAKTIVKKGADAWNESVATYARKDEQKTAVSRDESLSRDECTNEPTQAGKFCENCGQPLSPSAKFCKHCGTKRG